MYLYFNTIKKDLRCLCLHYLVIIFKNPSFMVFGYLSLSLRTTSSSVIANCCCSFVITGLLPPVIARSLYSLCHCELAEGKRGNHILYHPHSLFYYTFIYTHIFVFIFFPFTSPHTLYLCSYICILTNDQRPEYHCVYPCLRSGTENRPLYHSLSLRGAKRRGNHIHLYPHLYLCF